MTANSFVLLATTNPAKVQRLRSVIQTLGASCRTIADYPEFTSPSETGPSHEANAKLKAMYWSQACRGLAIASDGGMDIPALGSSWDSVFTNRATGTDSTDEDRRLRLLEIMKDLFLLKSTDVFQNFPDEQSLDNVMDEVYNLYYKNWNYKTIIDRGPVCTPGNLKVMQKHFKKPIRCVVLVRDLLDVLASYIKWFETEPTAFPNKSGCKNIEEKLSKIMNKEGAVAKELMSIQYLLQHPEMAVFIKYDDLVQNPEQEIKKVYSFLNIHKILSKINISIPQIYETDSEKKIILPIPCNAQSILYRI